MQIAYDAHNWTAKLYNHVLLYTEDGREAYEYLKGRGIGDETIRSFGLGYAVTDSNVLIEMLKRKGYSEQDMANRKLLNISQKGNYYDPFYDRVIFPIFDFDGRVCAFGGRTMNKDSKIKYLNSPETRIYKKQDNLFGFKQAKEHVENQGYIVLVEGYFDTLQAHQHGMKNVVATLGTALTVEQALLIKSITKNVVIVYDNDEAGMDGACRNASILEGFGLTVQIGKTVDSEDPDEYFDKHRDRERFVEEVIKQAVNRSEFFVREKVNAIDKNNANQRFSLLNDMLNQLPNDITQRRSWLNAIHEKMDVNTSVVSDIIAGRV